MKNRTRLSAALLSMLTVAACFVLNPRDSAEAATRPQYKKSAVAAQRQSDNVGSLPGSVDSLYGPSFAYLAWGLFLEAMAPTNGSPTLESWTEQCELNSNMVGCPSAARIAAAKKSAGKDKVRLLHAGATGKMAGSDCGVMIRRSVGGFPAPSNLTRNATFCEEVYVSPPEANFLREAALTTLAGQRAYGKQHNGTISFPGTQLNEIREELDAVEVKLDWVPAKSFHPTFACPDRTNRLYTETINGTCYALAAVHITSKVMPTWLWATFEPNSSITNPNRCDPKLYGACFDPWGTTSTEPYTKGHIAQQSPELRQAMASEHLNPAFNNYFLTGVQTEFVDKDGKPTQLGNSFIEFNQGVSPGKSSCITCHQYASFDGKQPRHGAAENHFGKPLPGWPSIGYACNQHQNDNCAPAGADSTFQDFSWILGLMPYGGPNAKAPARQQKVSANPAGSLRGAVAQVHAASPERPPVAKGIAAPPPASSASAWAANQPAQQARVSWDSRGLAIEASNSSLTQILRQVAAVTSARLEGTVKDQRVFGSYGPGPASDVLLKLLDGSGYNLLMVGGRSADPPREIVLSARTPASAQTVASNQSRSMQAEQPDPDLEPLPESASAQPPSNPNPFGYGETERDPERLMQKILQRQQKIDEQAEQQQKQERQNDSQW